MPPGPLANLAPGTVSWSALWLQPNELGEAVKYVIERRSLGTPFEVIVSGATPFGERAKGQEIVSAFCDVEIRNSVGALGPGLDVRGEGGYVIAPPSLHPSGQAYRWAPNARIDEVELAALPAWLITLLVSPRVRSTSTQTGPWPTGTTVGPISWLDLTQLAAGVSEGQRDWELFRLACHLRWRGYPREPAEQIVVDAARRCRPPFPTRAALRKIDSAWRYAP